MSDSYYRGSRRQERNRGNVIKQATLAMLLNSSKHSGERPNSSRTACLIFVCHLGLAVCDAVVIESILIKLAWLAWLGMKQTSLAKEMEVWL